MKVVTLRSVHDGFSLLTRKHRKRIELDVVLEELIGLKVLSDEENKEKTKKEE